MPIAPLSIFKKQKIKRNGGAVCFYGTIRFVPPHLPAKLLATSKVPGLSLSSHSKLPQLFLLTLPVAPQTLATFSFNGLT